MHKFHLGFTPIGNAPSTIDNKQKGGFNMSNYYCNGFWFDTYAEARRYAEFLLEHKNLYRVIYTRSEMDAHAAEVTA